ncbi:MAG: aminoglycoside phosphotransferase family protein [archaeon]
MNQDIIDILHETPSKIKDLSVGNDYWVYRVSLPKKDVIIRYPKNKYYQKRMKTTEWVYVRARNKGVPCPQPIIRNNALLIETFMPGTEISKAQMTQDQEKKVFQQLGEILKKMHSVSIRGFGPLGKNKGRLRSWDAFWKNAWKEHMTEARRNKVFSANEYASLNLFFEKRPHYYGVGKLLHADVQPAHVLVKKGRISGIIDLSDAMSGDPAYDFEQLLFKAGKEKTAAAIQSHGKISRQRLSFYYLMGQIYRVVYQRKKRMSKKSLLTEIENYTRKGYTSV